MSVPPLVHKPVLLVLHFVRVTVRTKTLVFSVRSALSFTSRCSWFSQRPLEDIADREGSVFVPRGVDVPCLDQDKDWEFKPCNFKEGQVKKTATIAGLFGRLGCVCVPH